MPQPRSSPDAALTPPSGLRARDVMIAWGLYLVLALVASYPLVKTISTTLPGSLVDPLQHLWVMRWYRSCLSEWRSPWVCPGLQYPAGAALGNFSPLHLQSLAFLPISWVVGNDVLAFNLVWLLAMSTTGLGTFVLAYQAIGDRPCSLFAGMLAMLAAPVMLHGRSHLELITLGGFPLFLAAWMRFVDRPGLRTLAMAIGSYLLVSMSAAYYAVFSTIPAALYVVWACASQGRSAARWTGGRIAWMAGFAALVALALVLLFANQLWASTNGYAAERPVSEFNALGTAPWSFCIPTPRHRLSQFLPFNVYAAAGYSLSMEERASYLGLIALVLMHQAAVRKAPLARRGFLWMLLAALVLLAWGGEWKSGHRSYALPSGWLRAHVPVLRMLRVPARYNLLASVIAAVLAAAGLREMLSRVANRPARVGLYVALMIAAILDLLCLPFPTREIPEMPGCYRAILARDPKATFLEVPQHASTGSELSSLAGFWQSIHGGRTSAGYSGNGNARMDDRLSWNSPFRHVLLDDPAYLSDSDHVAVDLVSDVSFLDHAWLYLRANGYRYVVLHDWEGYADGYPGKLARLKRLLGPAKVFEDDRTEVYDAEKLSRPSRPVVLTMEGWRGPGCGAPMRAVGKEATLLVFNPSSGRGVRLSFAASAFRSSRSVRLRVGDRELARWEVAPGEAFRSFETPTIDLPEGTSTLSLSCDSEESPRTPGEQAHEADSRPFSLRVAWIAIAPGGSPPALAARLSARRESHSISTRGESGWHAHVLVGMFAALARLEDMPTRTWACHPKTEASRVKIETLTKSSSQR